MRAVANIGYLFGTKSSSSRGSALIFEREVSSALGITVSLALGPDGEEINAIGVTPNVIVELTPADFSAANDTQRAAALKSLQTRESSPTAPRLSPAPGTHSPGASRPMNRA